MAIQQNDNWVEKAWHTYLTTGVAPDKPRSLWFESKNLRPWIRRLPKSPRCRICYYPFEGVGGKLVHLMLGVTRSKMNPQLCNVCEQFAAKYQGGTELELSLLFADVRGSTKLAEGTSPKTFSKLINRFYKETTRILYQTNAMVEKLIGDEVTGIYVPGFAGPGHARVAVEAGKSILKATGHHDPNGPWIPVGIGVHTGIAYVGAVSADGGGSDIVVLGDAANTAARLASVAKRGEIIISEATRAAAGLQSEGMEAHRLQLKGRSEAVDAWSIPALP